MLNLLFFFPQRLWIPGGCIGTPLLYVNIITTIKLDLKIILADIKSEEKLRRKIFIKNVFRELMIIRNIIK